MTGAAIVAIYIGGAAFTFGLMLRRSTDPGLVLAGTACWPVFLVGVLGWWLGGVTRDR